MPTDSRKTILLATDHQRSVLNALDASRTHPIAYTPYGHRPFESDLLSLLGFNGERPDPATGHYHLGNGYRQFNPVLMRFNSPDSWSPFREGGLNAYAYCGHDPINRFDPNGHAWWKLLKRLRSLTQNTSIAPSNVSSSRSTANAGNLAGPTPTASAILETNNPTQSSRPSTWLGRWRENRQIKHELKKARRLAQIERYREARRIVIMRRAAQLGGWMEEQSVIGANFVETPPSSSLYLEPPPPSYDSLYPARPTTQMPAALESTSRNAAEVRGNNRLDDSPPPARRVNRRNSY